MGCVYVVRAFKSLNVKTSMCLEMIEIKKKMYFLIKKRTNIINSPYRIDDGR